MTLPEFAIYINSVNEEKCIGSKLFDPFYALYTMLHSHTEGKDMQITINSTNKTTENIYKFKLTPDGSTDLSPIAQMYQKYIITYFHKTFEVNTQLRKNGVLFIILEQRD